MHHRWTGPGSAGFEVKVFGRSVRKGHLNHAIGQENDDRKLGERDRWTILFVCLHADIESLIVDLTQEFNRAVDNAPIVDPAIPIIGNVSADLLNNATQVRNDLQSQLHSRVRWTETIKYILSQGITSFYEIGSGSVLISLLRRIDRQSEGLPLGSPQDFQQLES